jgi:DNA polymerase I-like protein with 3'-5' exonuclease and polymerase domains
MRPWQDGFYITCIGIVRSDGVRDVIWVEHQDAEPTEEWCDRVQGHLDWADMICAHNLKHDMTILRNYGISFEKIKLHCTMVTAYLLSGQDTRQRTFDLGSVAQHYGFPPKLDKVKALWKKGRDTYEINSDLLHEYVMDDCQKTLDICYRQIEDVEREGMQLVVNLQNEFTMSLSDMELYGFKFDTVLAEAMVMEYEAKMDTLANEIRNIAYADMMYDTNDELEEEFNPSSDVQRSALLFGGTFGINGKVWTTRELKCETKLYQKKGKVECSLPGLWDEPPTKKRNLDGSVPVDKTIISKLRCKTPEQKIVQSALTEYGKIKKAKETLRGKTETKGLLNKIGLDGWIHPNLNQAVTVTGRLSGSDPNTQNMPRGSTSPLKQCILPKYDEILQVDLSQIEWRCAAWLSQDPEMIHEINTGVDQHTEACVRADMMNLPFSKENRTKAKIFNFRMIYGGVAYGYYMDADMPPFPLKKWEGIVEAFKNKYHRLAQWWYEEYTKVMMGGSMTIPTGRQFQFLKGTGGEYPERNVKNYPVQGMAGGDILPLLAVMIRRGLRQAGLKSHYILTVHDSLVLDVVHSERSTVIALVQRCVASLQGAVSRYYNLDFNVHLDGELEVGKNYGSLKEL